MNLKDVEFTPVKGEGPGGQHKNKTLSGCKAVHVPTGITVTIHGRNFHKNKRKAIKALDKKIKEEERAEQAQKVKEHRDYKIHNTETIRTYHYKRGTVKDHRSGKTASLDKMMDGKINFRELSE